MKKKLVVFLGVLSFLVVLLLFSTESKSDHSTQNINVSDVLFQKEDMEFWLITDPHYIDETLYDDGSAFEYIKTTAAGKDLTYQKESLQALVAQVLKEKPDGLIVTGDITLNGEFISGEKFAEILAPIRQAEIEVLSSLEIMISMMAGRENSQMTHRKKLRRFLQQSLRKCFLTTATRSRLVRMRSL